MLQLPAEFDSTNFLSVGLALLSCDSVRPLVLQGAWFYLLLEVAKELDKNVLVESTFGDRHLRMVVQLTLRYHITRRCHEDTVSI